MNRYRCKHAVEAMQWINTDTNREAFADWFKSHDAEFKMSGVSVLISEGECGVAVPGDWVLWHDGDWLVMEDEAFREDYEVMP